METRDAGSEPAPPRRPLFDDGRLQTRVDGAKRSGGAEFALLPAQVAGEAAGSGP